MHIIILVLTLLALLTQRNHELIYKLELPGDKSMISGDAMTTTINGFNSSQRCYAFLDSTGDGAESVLLSQAEGVYEFGVDPVWHVLDNADYSGISGDFSLIGSMVSFSTASEVNVGALGAICKPMMALQSDTQDNNALRRSHKVMEMLKFVDNASGIFDSDRVSVRRRD